MNSSIKTAVFVDVQNIYYTCRSVYGKQFNYRMLWHKLAAEGEIVQAFAYAIDRGDEQQRKFQSALRHIGFDVKLKPYIQRADGSAKGDWDVGITIDMMEAAVQPASEIERLVLLSGDGDFDLLLQTLTSNYGKQAEVYGVADLTAKSLIDSATLFHPITNDLLL